MAWAFVVLVLWVVVMSATNGSLYALGTEDPNSPRELCSVIHAGYESQRSLMWAKVAFLALAYVASFSMCIAFGIFQRRTFNRLNVYATHADFVAMVEGLPPIKGSEKLEDMLKEEISKATSQDVVGVSVGWDFDKYADRIQEVLEADVLEAAEEEAAAAAAAAGTAPASGASGAAAAASSAASGPTAAAAAPASEGPRPMMVGSPEEIAKDLVSSPIALVVFRTESGRDAAVAEKKPIAFHGSTLQIKQVVSEPMGVNWENFSNTKKMRRERLSAAIKMIILAGFAWSVCIYLPYAWYASSFSYSNGDKPSGLMTVSLTVIVVLGNLVMYTTCAEAAKRIGYLLKDSEDGVYMVLYTFSILFNILLDAAVAGYISYRTAVAQRARTYGGILISDLTRAQAVFESFEIQRQLGMQVYKYCWPSMFLLPFIGEAVGANWFTLHLARLVVTTFPHIKGYKAQQALKIFVPMDAGRYADVLINIAAAVLIFFLPGGHTLSLFVTLILSHSFILCFDHFRVLRCVPSFCFCSSVTDEYAQMLSIIPCSLILVAPRQNLTASRLFALSQIR
ncbi:unnamed protein product [Effrenium voratum]|nr:unnamed protein product [Effrenium voratum]